MNEITHTPEKPKRGRRPGDTIGRAHILEAAIKEFGENGYQGATIRKISNTAKVDPKLVHYYFGTKEDLFSACISETFHSMGLAEILLSTAKNGTTSVGTQYLRTLLGLLEDKQLGPAYIGLIRSLGTHEEARQIFLRFLTGDLFSMLIPELKIDNPETRLTLVGSQIIGLVMVRYVLQVGPLAELPLEQVAALVGPTLDRYLTSILD